MDRELVRDLKDLFRYEPGITVTIRHRPLRPGRHPHPRPGRQPRAHRDRRHRRADAFSIGSFSNANRNFVDLDTLKRVEVVRGPSSALYGSDALGGVVAFVTKDPSDYLEEGKDAYFGFKLGYEGADDGLFGAATAAFGGDRWSGLVVLNHHQGQETENMGEDRSEGASRTAANPQDYDGRSLLTQPPHPDAGGWTHEQFNTKVLRKPDGSQVELAREFGFNDYQKTTEVDFAPAYKYWDATQRLLGQGARALGRFPRQGAGCAPEDEDRRHGDDHAAVRAGVAAGRRQEGRRRARSTRCSRSGSSPPSSEAVTG